MESIKEVEVTYADTDMAGIVYHANYIPWFELARTKFLKEMGFTMQDCFDHNLVFPIIDLHLKYKSPTRYLDDVKIVTSLVSVARTKTSYLHKVYANDVLSVEATITLAHADCNDFGLVNLKKRFEKLYDKYYGVAHGKD